MNECCRRYVNEWLDITIEWSTTARRLINDPPPGFAAAGLEAQSLIRCIGGRDFAGDPLGLTPAEVAEIVAGARECPWHNRIPEDYLAIMKAMGGSDGR